MARLMIGELARRTGTKVNTIRFYEDIGLMPKAARTASGRRTFGEEDVRRLAFIRNGRDLGFSTDELRSLISLSEQPDRDCGEAGAIARSHLADIEARIVRLRRLRDELEQVATTCEGGRIGDCRVIDAIADGDRPERPSPIRG
jgi:DNA-binding transcriptional MerR regulator